jgi:ketosteroid isomerase-like protein
VSQEDLENLRAHFEQWHGRALRAEARPWEAIDLSLFDPDVVFEDATMPDLVGERYRGHEDVVRALEGSIEPFEWIVVELEQIIDAGERVVSVHSVRAEAQYTGIEFDFRAAYLWTFRDGKVVHIQGSPSRKQALKAVGLEG